MEMEHAHPMEISIRGFVASHLLPLSTNQFFQLNGKQPLLKAIIIDKGNNTCRDQDSNNQPSDLSE